MNMDLLFFIRKKEPTEYNPLFCYHIRTVSFFIVFYIIYNCIHLLRYFFFSEVQESLTTRRFTLPILVLLFVSLMLIYHKKRIGVYLWGLVSILTLVIFYFMTKLTPFVMIAIFWLVVQIGFIWMMNISKDETSAWRVLFPKAD